MKKAFLILLCILLQQLGAGTAVLGQKEGKPLIDSMVRDLAGMKDDTNKVTLLSNISFAYYSENPDDGIRYGEQALALAQRLGWQKGIAKAYRYIGINYENKGAYPIALNSFFKALQINEDMKDSLSIAKSMSNIGIIYDDQKEYDKALKFYNSGLKIFTKLDDKINIALNLGNIALVYSGLRNIPKALEYDSLALNMYTQLNDKGGITRSIGNMGIHFAAKGNFALALQYDLRALQLYKEEDNKYGQALTYGCMGDVYYVLATDSTLQLENNELYGTDKNKNLHIAADYLAQSLTIAKRSGYLNLVCDNGNTFAHTQERLGNYKEALASYRDYAELKDSVFNDESRLKIQNLSAQRELDLKDKQIELDQLAIAKRRNEQVFYIVGIALLLIVIGVIARNNRVQQKLNATISTLVNEQEITITQRTSALTDANKKLLDLIQFNAHNIREPLTRIMGTMMLREMSTDTEFMEEYCPMLDQSVHDLDDTLKKVIEAADKETGKL